MVKFIKNISFLLLFMKTVTYFARVHKGKTFMKNLSFDFKKTYRDWLINAIICSYTSNACIELIWNISIKVYDDGLHIEFFWYRKHPICSVELSIIVSCAKKSLMWRTSLTWKHLYSHLVQTVHMSSTLQNKFNMKTNCSKHHSCMCIFKFIKPLLQTF